MSLTTRKTSPFLPRDLILSDNQCELNGCTVEHRVVFFHQYWWTEFDDDTILMYVVHLTRWCITWYRDVDFQGLCWLSCFQNFELQLVMTYMSPSEGSSSLTREDDCKSFANWCHYQCIHITLYKEIMCIMEVQILVQTFAYLGPLNEYTWWVFIWVHFLSTNCVVPSSHNFALI